MGNAFRTGLRKDVKMKNIYARISDIQYLLKAKTGLKPSEKASLIEELSHLERILSLWSEFGDVPMDPETECLEKDWHGFPKGTFREDIWHWFESEFHVSVCVLLYKGGYETYPEKDQVFQAHAKADVEMRNFSYTCKKMIPLRGEQAYRLALDYPVTIYVLFADDNGAVEVSAKEIKEKGFYHTYGIEKDVTSK